MSETKLSVIIPVYNENEIILDCLESLGKQTHPNFEIIVVDDGSTDRTFQKLTKLKEVVPDLIVIRQDHKGPGAARNLGASKASGQILVFVDADMTFDKDFLKDLVKPIIDGKTKGTFSKNEFVANWDNIWARCWNMNEGWEDKKRHPKNYPDRQKVFRAIIKREFDKVGGFNQGGYTDDYSLSEKLGYEAESVEGAFFYHKNPNNLKEIFLQAKWSGKRSYKLGIIGTVIALIRASFPISAVIGIYKSVKNITPQFLIFKLIYDAGVFFGVIEYFIFGKSAK